MSCDLQYNTNHNITAYITKFGAFNITQFAAKQELHENDLLTFLYWFTPAIVGPKTWKSKCQSDNYSDIMTVSDEAYLYLMVESNYDKWNYLRQRSVSALYVVMLCYICNCFSNMYKRQRKLLRLKLQEEKMPNVQHQNTQQEAQFKGTMTAPTLKLDVHLVHMATVGRNKDAKDTVSS